MIPPQSSRRLAEFSGSGYDVGRPVYVRALWLLTSGMLVQRWWCPPGLRRAVLRLFGADIAPGAFIRHRVRVHWPWKLTVGADSWIGEGTWVLNLEPVVIGANVCVSQEVLLCTGSHDRRSPTFEFDNAPIHLLDGCWVATRATILRGVTIGRRATVGATALVSRDVADDDTVLAPQALSTCRDQVQNRGA